MASRNPLYIAGTRKVKEGPRRIHSPTEKRPSKIHEAGEGMYFWDKKTKKKKLAVTKEQLDASGAKNLTEYANQWKKNIEAGKGRPKKTDFKSRNIPPVPRKKPEQSVEKKNLKGYGGKRTTKRKPTRNKEGLSRGSDKVQTPKKIVKSPKGYQGAGKNIQATRAAYASGRKQRDSDEWGGQKHWDKYIAPLGDKIKNLFKRDDSDKPETYLGAMGARTGGYLGAGKALRGYGKVARKKGGKI